MTSTSSNKETDDLLCVGVISGVHGIKGEVKLKTFTAFPEDIASYGILLDKTGKPLFEINKFRSTPKALIVKLSTVTDRNQAESLKGTELFIQRKSLPEPQQDEFYYSDLSGLDVKLEDGSIFGTIHAIQNYGAGDLVEINPAPADNKKNNETVFYNFTQAIFPTINIEEGYVMLHPPQTIEDSQNEQEAFLKSQQK